MQGKWRECLLGACMAQKSPCRCMEDRPDHRHSQMATIAPAYIACISQLAARNQVHAQRLPRLAHRPAHRLPSARTSRSHILQQPTTAQVAKVAMQQLLGHQRGLAPRCPTANRGRLPLRASAAASGSGSGSSDVKSARLSRILRQYESAGGWLPPAAAAAASCCPAPLSCRQPGQLVPEP